MKKILIFSLAYHPHVGGAEVAIKEITNRLEEVSFHMITLRLSPRDSARERVGRVEVHRLGSGQSGYAAKIFFVLRAARYARRLHARERFHGAWAMMSYMTLPLVLARLPIPYLLTLQEGDTEAHMFSRAHILPFLPLIRRGFRGAAVVQAISTHLGAWARKRGFEGPVEIIPNGVDAERFAGEKVPHEGLVLITTSRLVHKNAVDDIIRALALLPPRVRLVIAGTGQEEARLKALAEQLVVAERVEWLGHVAHEDLPGLLHRADIFVRPSRSEGLGNSFLEAMAAGLPVIATQEGGLRDFISKQTAFVVEKDNPEQIARRVQEILDNPAAAAHKTAAARALVEQKYDWNRVAALMREKIFSKLI